MPNTDYISGTEDAYKSEVNNALITVQVSGVCESQKSFGCLVDLLFDEQGYNTSASRQEWFPKSMCSLEEVEFQKDHFGKQITCKKWFLTAPKWMLDNKKIN